MDFFPCFSRYVYFVRSMDIEDSDNPHVHRIFLTAGDLLGKERGSSYTGADGKSLWFWFSTAVSFLLGNDQCFDNRFRQLVLTNDSVFFGFCGFDGCFIQRSTGGNIEQNRQTNAHGGGILRHGRHSVESGHNGQWIQWMFFLF